MTLTAPHAADLDPSPVLARFTARLPGPTLIAIGGMHGNEPAGVRALERIVHSLSRTHQIGRGEFLALRGNPPALAARCRYIDTDLNRRWTPTLAGDPAGVEEEIQRRLQSELHTACDQARGPVYVLDLHTMSGSGRPFAVFADTIRSRLFAKRFSVPLLLGFDEHLNGTLIDYLAALGHAAVIIEGGNHDEPQSVENLLAALWIALGHCRLVTDPADPKVVAARRGLRALTRGVPPALEVTHHHLIAPGTPFNMVPGFATFDFVTQGTPLASDQNGQVVAPSDGFLLLPLYQPLGDDGFFLARPVRRFWLVLSRVLRTLRAGRIVHWLPGVERDPGRAGELIVDRRVAKWVALQILHLLGYRRLEDDGTTLRVQRRRHDLT